MRTGDFSPAGMMEYEYEYDYNPRDSCGDFNV